MVAYQTAYMKANYPVEYMTALLTAESNDKDKISAAVSECRRIKIKVLPPDINNSNVGFDIVEDKDSFDKKGILFGFSAIKNVGEAATTAILSARKEGPFSSFSDFLSRVDGRKVNKKVLESLIKVGAMSSFGSRAALLSSMDAIRDKVKPKEQQGQAGLFATGELKKTEASTIINIASVQEFSDEELESLERQLLGLSLSAKPISELVGPLLFQSTHKIYEITVGESFPEMVRIAGVVMEVKVITTKKTGAEMAFAKIDDGTSSIELVVFPKIFRETRDFWIEGRPLLVIGKVDIRDETAGVIVESIETLNSLNEKKEREVFVKIPKYTNVDSLKKLKNLFLQNPGEQSCFLLFEGGKKVKLSFKINWNESLAKQISEVLEGQNLAS